MGVTHAYWKARRGTKIRMVGQESDSFSRDPGLPVRAKTPGKPWRKKIQLLWHHPQLPRHNHRRSARDARRERGNAGCTWMQLFRKQSGVSPTGFCLGDCYYFQQYDLCFLKEYYTLGSFQWNKRPRGKKKTTKKTKQKKLCWVLRFNLRNAMQWQGCVSCTLFDSVKIKHFLFTYSCGDLRMGEAKERL